MPTLQTTIEQTHTPERNDMNKWSQAKELVDSFQFEPDFIGQLMQQGVSPSNPSSREYMDTMSSYSESFLSAHELDQTVDPGLAQQVTLISNAPLYVNSQKELNYFEHKRKREGRLSDDDWVYFKTLKPYVIWYNQQLSDYAYTHPQDAISDINEALIDTAIPSHPGDERLVEQHLSDTTRGARTEAVTRQLLDVAGVPYSPGSAEEDSSGGDIILHYKGNNVKVDIKSSLSDIAHVRGGYDEINEKHLMYAIHKRPNERKENHVVKLYPGFEDKDIGNALGIKTDTDFAFGRAQMIAIQLQKALQELDLTAK